MPTEPARKLNDAMETAAVKTALGPDSRHVPMSSIKSMIGHLIGAAGAVEAAATALSIRTGVIPPTINLCSPDPACDLDYVPNEARQRQIRRAMNNSFGFGGQNAALIMAKSNQQRDSLFTNLAGKQPADCQFTFEITGWKLSTTTTLRQSKYVYLKFRSSTALFSFPA